VIVHYPCHAYAQEAEMSLGEYEDFVYQATFADQPDPVARWRKIHKRQAELIAWLDGKKKLTVRGPNADLSLSVAGRTFINGDGTFNMPSGEIYTSPLEDSAEGRIRFTCPAIREQRSVEGVEFRFEVGGAS
jgi:aminopeptidase